MTICINYSNVTFHGNENSLKLMHFEGGTWRNVTVSRDTVNNIICGSVTSFSPFVIAKRHHGANREPRRCAKPAPPPSHDLVNVGLSVTATDNGDVSPTFCR